MATKTGNSYITGSTTDSVEIPTASPGFSTMASLNKVSPSDCDNDRQSAMAMSPQNRKYLYFWNYDRWDDNSNGKSGVSVHAQREETDPRRLRQRPTTRNGNTDVLGANLAICGSRSLSQSFG